MDDKKFNEIMHKYVSGKTRGMEADFSKLNEKENKMFDKKYKNRLIRATASFVVVIIVIALSIILHLTLSSFRESGDDTQTPVVSYFEEEELAIVLVDSKDDLTSKYNINAIMPIIEGQGGGYCVLRSRVNDDVIGAYIELSVFDEYFDVVKMHIVSENNALMLLGYKTLPYQSSWRNNTVKYIVEHDEDLDCYNVRLFFVLDGYKYYLDAQYYEDLNVEEILDLIF